MARIEFGKRRTKICQKWTSSRTSHSGEKAQNSLSQERMVSSKEYIDKEVSDYPYFNTLHNSNNSIEFKSRFAIKRIMFINKLSKTFLSGEPADF